MTDAETETHRQFIDAVVQRLEALGWEFEWSDVGDSYGYIEVWRPDPDKGYAMRFSGWWISWRLVDGKLGYGVGDDTSDLRWRQSLNADISDPVAVADAADQAMHMLWHVEERDLRAELYAQADRMNRLKQRIEVLAYRVLVTPGQLRDALKSTSEGRP
jgi:hypothetical protein